jgi:hypothetical protein
MESPVLHILPYIPLFKQMLAYKAPAIALKAERPSEMIFPIDVLRPK